MSHTDPSGMDFILVTGRATGKLGAGFVTGKLEGGHTALEYWKSENDPTYERLYNKKAFADYIKSQQGKKLIRQSSVELFQEGDWFVKKSDYDPATMQHKNVRIEPVNISYIVYDYDIKNQELNFDQAIPIKTSATVIDPAGVFESKKVKQVWDGIVARAKTYAFAEQPVLIGGQQRPGIENDKTLKAPYQFPLSIYEMSAKIATGKTNTCNTFVHFMLKSAGLDDYVPNLLGRFYKGLKIPSTIKIPQGEAWGPPFRK